MNTRLPRLLPLLLAVLLLSACGGGESDGPAAPPPAAGGADVIARPVAQRITESMAQGVIVDNRLGAGGVVGSQAVAFSSAPYFPLPDGATWTYTASSGGTFTLTVVGKTTFNEFQVKVVRDDSGGETYYTNDAGGVYLYGTSIPDPYWGIFTEFYSSGVNLAQVQDSVLGTPVNSEGYVIKYGGLMYYYYASSTPISVEAVTVPAGNFPNAVRWRTTIWIPEEGILLDDTAWRVPGIGVVKQQLFDTIYYSTTIWELSSSNLSVRAVRADFNADGRSDILER